METLPRNPSQESEPASSKPLAPAVLEAQAVSVRLGGKEILHDVSVSVHPGELIMVLGPNGSGKSTLLQALSGERACERGRVLLGGAAIEGLPLKERARRLAMVEQQAPPPRGFTVREVVMLGRAPFQGAWLRASLEDEAVIAQTLADWELSSVAHEAVDTLSGGEQRRVMLACAFAQRTAALLLDEPATYLDVRHAIELHERLRRQVDEAHLACLMVSHDLHAAMLYADRVLLLSSGQLVASGTPREVLTAMKLEAVFQVPFVVATHAESGVSFVTPARRKGELSQGKSTQRS